MNVLDFVFIGLLVLFGIAGYRRGMAKVLMRLGATAISLIVARIAAVPLSEYIYNIRIHGIVAEKLNAWLPEGSVGGSLEALVESILNALPEGTEQIVDYLHLLPVESGESLYTVAQIENDYVQPIITKVVVLITTVVLFTLFSFILMMIVNAIDNHYFKENHNVIGTINRIGGAVIGFVRGVIPVGIIAVAMNLIAPLLSDQGFTDLVSGSYFCSLLTNLF